MLACVVSPVMEASGSLIPTPMGPSCACWAARGGSRDLSLGITGGGVEGTSPDVDPAVACVVARGGSRGQWGSSWSNKLIASPPPPREFHLCQHPKENDTGLRPN